MSLDNFAMRLMIAAFLSASLIGCGGGDASSSGPKTYPVKGTVTQKGKPVDGAQVSFVQVEGRNSAAGRTDSNGQYTLSTAKPGDGAVVGQYKVSITKYDQPSTPSSTSEADYTPPTPGQAESPPKSLLPPKYANPATSGLTATVAEGAENKFDFTVD